MTIFDDTARRNMGEHGSSYDTMGPNVFRFEEFQAALRPHYSKATTVAEWEVEYDEYCASLEAEAYEAVNDNGFIMYLQPAEHHKGTPSQVAAERGCDTLMSFLVEMRNRAVEQFEFSYGDDGSPRLHLYFHDNQNDLPGKATVVFGPYN